MYAMSFAASLPAHSGIRTSTTAACTRGEKGSEHVRASLHKDTHEGYELAISSRTERAVHFPRSAESLRVRSRVPDCFGDYIYALPERMKRKLPPKRALNRKSTLHRGLARGLNELVQTTSKYWQSSQVGSM